MTRQMALLFCVGLLLVAIVPGSHASAPTQSSSSFHSLLTSSNSNSVQENLSPECVQAVQKTLRDGKDFYSQVVVQNSIPLSAHPDPQVRSGEFFHRTRSGSLLRVAETQQYEQLFGFIRSQCRDQNGGCMVGWHVFLSADPDSILQYGRLLFKFKISPDSRMFLFTGNGSAAQLNKLIENEMIAKEPSLQSCREQYFSEGYGAPSILEALALEASDVAVSAYYGLSKQNPDGSFSRQWLQLIGPWLIQSMEPMQ